MQNIRSATLIDLSYGLLLMGFGNLTSVPMSTTWAFIGILAGREIALNYRMNQTEMGNTYKLIVKDLAKVNLGLAISILVAWVIRMSA